MQLNRGIKGTSKKCHERFERKADGARETGAY